MRLLFRDVSHEVKLVDPTLAFGRFLLESVLAVPAVLSRHTLNGSRKGKCLLRQNCITASVMTANVRSRIVRVLYTFGSEDKRISVSIKWLRIVR